MRLRLPYRLAGTALCIACAAASFSPLYLNTDIYNRTENKAHINEWSAVEQYLSRGCIYSFLNSFKDFTPTPPVGYDEEQAAALLAQYEESAIPEDQKVSVVGIMLEAFCDLTDFPPLAANEEIQAIYAPWHKLEAQAVHGDMISNSFVGGTINPEQAFLTGDTQYVDHRKAADSYAWYFKRQGYQTFGYHLFHRWFYNRLNVNPYLGLDDYTFFEDLGYSGSPYDMFFDSDQRLVDLLLSDLANRLQDGPCFSFSVSAQNHGQYADTFNRGISPLLPEETGLSEQTCFIFNNYLNGIANTVQVLSNFTRTLDTWQEPIVLVLFGDHKPWAGVGSTAYADLGVDISASTLESIYNRFSTPYLIWANTAAKKALGKDFVGEGGDFSACFLMAEVFDQCGWEGPAFMQLSRDLRDRLPVIHQNGFYFKDGLPIYALSEEDNAFYQQYLGAQFYRRNYVNPTQQ